MPSASVSLSQVWSAACRGHPSVHRQDQHGALLSDGGHAAPGQHFWCRKAGDSPSQSERTSCQATRHRYVPKGDGPQTSVRQYKETDRRAMNETKSETEVWLETAQGSNCWFFIFFSMNYSVKCQKGVHDIKSSDIFSLPADHQPDIWFTKLNNRERNKSSHLWSRDEKKNTLLLQRGRRTFYSTFTPNDFFYLGNLTKNK